LELEYVEREQLEKFVNEREGDETIKLEPVLILLPLTRPETYKLPPIYISLPMEEPPLTVKAPPLVIDKEF
jgi:hypothetical protein